MKKFVDIKEVLPSETSSDPRKGYSKLTDEDKQYFYSNFHRKRSESDMLNNYPTAVIGLMYLMEILENCRVNYVEIRGQKSIKYLPINFDSYDRVFKRKSVVNEDLEMLIALYHGIIIDDFIKDLPAPHVLKDFFFNSSNLLIKSINNVVDFFWKYRDLFYASYRKLSDLEIATTRGVSVLDAYSVNNILSELDFLSYVKDNHELFNEWPPAFIGYHFYSLLSYSCYCIEHNLHGMELFIGNPAHMIPHKYLFTRIHQHPRSNSKLALRNTDALLSISGFHHPNSFYIVEDVAKTLIVEGGFLTNFGHEMKEVYDYTSLLTQRKSTDQDLVKGLLNMYKYDSDTFSKDYPLITELFSHFNFTNNGTTENLPSTTEGQEPRGLCSEGDSIQCENPSGRRPVGNSLSTEQSSDGIQTASRINGVVLE